MANKFLYLGLRVASSLHLVVMLTLNPRTFETSRDDVFLQISPCVMGYASLSPLFSACLLPVTLCLLFQRPCTHTCWRRTTAF